MTSHLDAVPLQEPRSQPMPGALRVGQVAKLLRVSPRSVNRWALAGKIPATRTRGGHWRIDRAALANFLE